jgi:hypothetical protein
MLNTRDQLTTCADMWTIAGRGTWSRGLACPGEAALNPQLRVLGQHHQLLSSDGLLVPVHHHHRRRRTLGLSAEMHRKETLPDLNGFACDPLQLHETVSAPCTPRSLPERRTLG